MTTQQICDRLTSEYREQPASKVVPSFKFRPISVDDAIMSLPKGVTFVAERFPRGDYTVWMFRGVGGDGDFGISATSCSDVRPTLADALYHAGALIRRWYQ